MAWAAPTGPTRGKARVYLDGRYVATIDQYSRTFKAKVIVFARNVGEGRHTLRIQTARDEPSSHGRGRRSVRPSTGLTASGPGRPGPRRLVSCRPPAAIVAEAGPHSSRGLGHRPLKAEITGSNPVCGTNIKNPSICRSHRPRTAGREEHGDLCVIPGGGGDPWEWHRLVPELEARGTMRSRSGCRPTTTPPAGPSTPTRSSPRSATADVILVADRWAASPRRSSARDAGRAARPAQCDDPGAGRDLQCVVVEH